MTLIWPRAVEEELKAWAEKCYPYEGCGVLVGRSEGDLHRVVRFESLENTLRHLARIPNSVLITDTVSDTLGTRILNEGRFEFVMSPDEFNKVMLKAADEDLDVVGIVHTHPDHPAKPSPTDENQHMLAGWSNVIVKVDQGKYVEARSWVRDEENRPFEEEPILTE